MYNMLKNDVDNNMTYNGLNWAFQIKQILDNLGLSNIWIYQNTTDISFDLIKQRIFDTYKQSWYSSVNNSYRLEMYARYKHNFELENYLNFITEKKYRVALTQFRLSSHDLAIERGRYENINRSERICKLCNMKSVECEYHFLLVCPFYRELRQKYFRPYYCHWPTINKFEDLMTKTNRKIILIVAKFLYDASNLRKINTL